MASEKNLIIIAGPPLAGKSSLSTTLGKMIKAQVLIQDDVLTEIIPNSDRNLQDRISSYMEMHSRAQRFLDLGENVILEGTYSRSAYRSGLITLSGFNKIVIIEIRIEPDEALKRFQKRTGHPGTNNTIEIIELAAKNYAYSDEAIQLDSLDPTENHATKIMQLIKSDINQNLNSWVRSLD